MARRHLRIAAVAGAFALSTAAVAPALAAGLVSQSGANAVTLSVAGNGQGSGLVTARNDGTRETRSGDATPPTSVLSGQSVLDAGVLAQEATARADGTSAACAGLAGNGGTVQVGESRCLTPGTPVNATLGSLKLGKLSLTSASRALAPLSKLAAPKGTSSSSSSNGTASPAPQGAGQDGGSSVDGTATDKVTDALTPGSSSAFSSSKAPAPRAALPSGIPDLGALTDPATKAIDDAIAQLQNAIGGDLGLVAGFGLVEGRCTAAPGTASGSATLADAGVKVVLPGRTITVLDLPVDPPPNTHLTTDLSKVATVLLNALRTDLDNSFDGAGSPLTAVPDAVQTQIVDNVVTQVEPQLAPLEQNLLDVTLNRQIRPTADSIKVRALDAQVLPAAASALGSSALELQVGNAACGPGARTAQAAAPAPAMPTAVSAGLDPAAGVHGQGQGSDHANQVLLGAFAVLLTAAAGAMVWRRRA